MTTAKKAGAAAYLTENESLRRRLEEADETLRAIGNGEVDAFVVSGPDGRQIFTLKGAEQPYRILVETMNEGAATLGADGTILYCNNRLAAMLQVPPERLTGRDLGSFVAPPDQPVFSARLGTCAHDCDSDEILMLTEAGNPVPVLISCCANELSGGRGISIVITDLTQQKRNTEIMAAERLARSIIEQAGEAIVVCDEGGTIIRASGLTRHLCGENPLLKPFDELFHLRFLETAGVFSVKAPLLGARLENVEVEFNLDEDCTFHLLLNATPLRDSQNSVIGCVVTLTDISARKKTELALRQSEERYRSLFNSLLEGFCIIEVLLDQDGHPGDFRFLEINPVFESLTGLQNAQGKRMRELAPEPEAHWFEVYGNVALTGEPARFVHEAKSLNRWFEVSAYRIDGPESHKVAILFNDITAAKQAEVAMLSLNRDLENRVAARTEELAATVENLKGEISEREIAEASLLRLNRLYLVLSQTNQAVVRTKDLDTLFEEFCRITVEDGGFRLAWVGLVDEESGRLKVAASSGATGYLDDIRVTVNITEASGLGPTGLSVRSGTYCISNDFLSSPITRPWHERAAIHGIRASASIPLEIEGKVFGALTLYADEKNFFDEQQIVLLQQIGADFSFAIDNINRETRRQEIERALYDQTAKRLRTVEELREKEQMLIQQSRQAAMGEMIGNIAHQWRQPLNTLGLAIQQLKMMHEFGECTEDVMSESVEKSMALIQYMSKTIDDFRDYFKPDKDKAEFKVSEVIASTLLLVEDSFKHQHVAIEVITEQTPVIMGYRNEFAQSLLNILNNARDALTERKTETPRVTVTISSERGRAVVTVADNAGGIPMEIIGKIFDPYFTTKGPQAGTGLGLFMSKTIVEKNLGGSLTVRNTAVGAEFRIEV
jgi:PAS domain S-box-containing protein